MDLIIRWTNGGAFCFPRTRGDGPGELVGFETLLRFPPHTRGWTVLNHGEGLGVDVSPAHAGMDRYPLRLPWGIKCFPRTRGDGPLSRNTRSFCASFPPHTRGWTLLVWFRVYIA